MNAVRSADGSRIAFVRSGTGPAVILVGGAFCDHRAKAAGLPLAALLEHSFTVVSFDRRGRGESTEASPWSLDREVEDLAALVAEVGGSASLYGISSGAILVLEAAARGVAVDRLAAYEPPFALDPAHRPPVALIEELEEHVRRGRRSEAAELFLTRVVRVPAPAVAGMKQAPMWRGLEAMAPTLAYDLRIMHGAASLLERAPRVTAPALLLTGGASPAWMREGAGALAAAIPNGEHRVLEGQTHDVDPAILAPALAAFLR